MAGGMVVVEDDDDVEKLHDTVFQPIFFNAQRGRAGRLRE